MMSPRCMLLPIAGCALIVLLIDGMPFPVLAATTCDRISQSPYVNLTANPGQTNYITDHDKNDLRRLRAGLGMTSRDWQPIGLTLTELGLGLSVSVRAAEMPNGQLCAEIAAVEATIGYDVFDVFIASEYPRGSCQYDSILDHERRHVVIFQTTLDQYFSQIEQTIRQKANSIKPIMVRDIDTATDRFLTIIHRAVKPLFKKLNRDQGRQHDAIDTVENYEREAKNCVTW